MTKSPSFFENSRNPSINGGNFVHTENRVTQRRENVFHGPIYGYMHTATNDGPVIGYYNRVSIESDVSQRSPSLGKSSLVCRPRWNNADAHLRIAPTRTRCVADRKWHPVRYHSWRAGTYDVGRHANKPRRWPFSRRAWVATRIRRRVPDVDPRDATIHQIIAEYTKIWQLRWRPKHGEVGAS